MMVFGTSYMDVGGGERRAFLCVGDSVGLMSLFRFGGLGKLYAGVEEAGSIKLAMDGDALALVYFGGGRGGVDDLTGALKGSRGVTLRGSMVAERMGS